MSDNQEIYLTCTEAAQHLRLSPRTLEKMRVIGNGPRFRKFGHRVVYARSDIDVWAAARSFDNTPEIRDSAIKRQGNARRPA